MKAIITGHGNFASGMLSALSTVYGGCENVFSVDFDDGMSVEELDREFDGIFSSAVNEKIFVFADLGGATPFNRAVILSQDRENVRVISGTNLAMLLTFLSEADLAENDEKLVKSFLTSAGEDVRVFDMGSVSENQNRTDFTDGI